MPKKTNDISDFADLGAEPAVEEIGGSAVSTAIPSGDFADLGAEILPVAAGSASNVPNEDKTQTLKDLIRAGSQGATLGFGDEIAGALLAGKDAAKGALTAEPLPFEQTLEDYRKYRDMARKQTKEAEERSPIISTIGSLGGGLLTGGLGVAGKASKGLSLLDKIKQGTIASGKLGGAFAAGQSEADLTKGEVAPLAKDVGVGALVGGTVGGTLTATGALVPKLAAGAKETVRQSEILSDLLESFRRGKAGQSLVGKETRRGIEKQVEGTGEDVFKALQSELRTSGKAKEKLIKRAEEEGQTIDIKRILESAEKRLENTPAISEKEISEKQGLLKLIRSQLYETKEKTKMVKAGETIKSGEERALDKLLGRKFKTEAEQVSGAPEKQAEAKLREMFAKKESLTTEGTPFTDEFTKLKSSSGPEILKTPSIDENMLSQLIKKSKPGEVQTFTDPSTGKNMLGYVDEITGKFVSEPVPEIYGQTPVKLEKYIEQLPKETRLSPSQVSDFEKTVSQLTKLGDDSLKTYGAESASRQLEKGLKGSLRSLEKYGPEMQRSDQISSAVMTAQDILYPALKGITGQERSSINKSIASTIRKLEQDTQAGISARQVVEDAFDGLRKVRPELSDQLKEKMVDKATAYDLSRKIGQESIQKSFFGPVRAMGLGGSNLVGQATRKLSPNISSFIKGATPEVLQNIASKMKDSGLAKQLSAAAGSSDNRRQAILFSLLQNPGYRKALGLTANEQEGEE